MKLRCERDVLVEALGTAGRAAVAKTAALPVLSGLRLQLAGDRLEVTGTDMDLTISAVTTVAGEEDGVVVAPGRLLVEIVRALEPGAVTVEGDEEEVRIAAGRSSFSVRSHPVGDFPRVVGAVGEEVRLPAESLAEGLRQVTRAASNEDSRPILTGVLMEAEGSGIRLVATDSYRLAVRDLPGIGVLPGQRSVLVPSRALSELQRLLAQGGVTLLLGQHDATFRVGDVSLTTRLIEGEFPNYRALIPTDYPNRLVVTKGPFLDAIRRVRLVAREATTPVRIAMSAQGIELTVITADWGTASEEVDAKYEGAEMTIAFNPTFLAEGVEAVESDEVLLDTRDALKPATLRGPDRQDYLYLLMPIRVS